MSCGFLFCQSDGLKTQHLEPRNLKAPDLFEVPGFVVGNFDAKSTSGGGGGGG